MTNWWEMHKHDRHKTKDTHIRVLTARRLIVLLRNFLRSRGHRNSVVKNSVMKLQGMRLAIEELEKGPYRS